MWSCWKSNAALVCGSATFALLLNFLVNFSKYKRHRFRILYSILPFQIHMTTTNLRSRFETRCKSFTEIRLCYNKVLNIIMTSHFFDALFTVRSLFLNRNQLNEFFTKYFKSSDYMPSLKSLSQYTECISSG